MKLITAVIRPDRLPFVKEALFRIGITGLSMWRVTGHGGEQEVVQHYRGTTVVHDFHEKVRIEMACSETFVEPAIAAIIEGARTGEVGDGKIFVQPIEEVVRIRTGERNDRALTAVNAEAVQRKSIAYRVVVEDEA
jgi:nitrogen regulatory protein P-II 1